MLYVAGRDHPDVESTSTTAQYWCLHTMSAVGPDGELALPEHCGRDRECHEDD
jgi:hypothetical protein